MCGESLVIVHAHGGGRTASGEERRRRGGDAGENSVCLCCPHRCLPYVHLISWATRGNWLQQNAKRGATQRGPAPARPAAGHADGNITYSNDARAGAGRRGCLGAENYCTVACHLTVVNAGWPQCATATGWRVTRQRQVLRSRECGRLGSLCTSPPPYPAAEEASSPSSTPRGGWDCPGSSNCTICTPPP